jgi:gliding motility associated protien GldN
MTTKKIMSAFVWSLCFFMAATTFAQNNNNVTESGNVEKAAPRDGFYDRYLHKEKQVLAYDYIHEKDVFWEKRVWRLIDTREKRNHIFRNENKNGDAAFINILIEAGQAGDITLYHHSFGGEFSTPMTQKEAEGIGRSTDTIITFDPVTFEEIIKIVYNDLNWEDINTYRLKEVYFFDEETSTLDVRILGIAPIIDRVADNGSYLNSGPLFWAYYPELRETLARTEAFNPDNDAARMSWEDIFEARLFSSYITKESNVLDRRIQDYKTEPMAILLESDKIKEGIFHFDHDLWTY